MRDSDFSSLSAVSVGADGVNSGGTGYSSTAKDLFPFCHNLMHLQPGIACRFNVELQLTLRNDYL